MNDYVSKAEVLDIYAELYDVFDNNIAILKEINKVYDKINELKAQEPRLITNADFENKELVDSAGSMPAWIEYRHGEEWDEYNDGNDDEWSMVYQFNFESEFYRCWTSRPTDEQRKAVKWDDRSRQDY